MAHQFPPLRPGRPPIIKAQEQKKTRIGTSKLRSLGKIFEITLDLLFHLWRDTLFERLEDFFAEIARRFIIVLPWKAELLGIEAGEAAFDIKLRKLRHAVQRRHGVG